MKTLYGTQAVEYVRQLAGSLTPKSTLTNQMFDTLAQAAAEAQVRPRSVYWDADTTHPDHDAIMESVTEHNHWLAGDTAGFVSGSYDPAWPKWAVCYPGRSTQWFDTKEQAQQFLEGIRNAYRGKGVPAN